MYGFLKFRAQHSGSTCHTHTATFGDLIQRLFDLLDAISHAALVFSCMWYDFRATKCITTHFGNVVCFSGRHWFPSGCVQLLGMYSSFRLSAPLSGNKKKRQLVRQAPPRFIAVSRCVFRAAMPNRIVAVLLVLPVLASGLLSISHAADRGALSPVTRVAELLKGLAQKIEDEQKQEEDLFTTYLCWGKSVVSQKEAANTAAQSRIDQLNTFITDLEAGRIDITSERVDLQKEIASLMSDMEQATQLRNQENKDYLAAKKEMEEAVDALTRALRVLRTGMGKAFIALKAHAFTNTFAAQKEESDQLDRAVAIGSKMLSRGDAVFLRRILDADAPEPSAAAKLAPTKDWKKLNRRGFQANYTARSEKIESLLQSMMEEFSADLQEATAKEDAAQTLHGKLMTTKGGQKTAAETSLTSMSQEGGSRALSKSDAQAELAALDQQVIDDKAFITSTNTAMGTKKTEWGKRETVRQGELAAISEAVSVLHSDDARDLMKRSQASRGYLFLQEASSAKAGVRREVAEVLRVLARKTGDRRLAGLSSLAAKTHFDVVIGHIDTLLTDLKGEMDTELTKKETCETDRSTDTRTAIVSSREIDDFTDSITSSQGKIDAIDLEVGEKEEELEKINETLAQMLEIRDKETQEYLKAKKDDEDAAVLVGNAKTVLTTFYATIALVQAKAGQPVQTVAGEAPPPPPPTWTAEYKGKKGESKGIISILGMIKTDLEADVAAATTSEGKAQTAYDAEKLDLEGEQTSLGTQISTLSGQKSGHETDITNDRGSRTTDKGTLTVLLKKIKDAESFCDWILINWVAREANRQAEISGLEEAKAILNGADFGGLQLSHTSS